MTDEQIQTFVDYVEWAEMLDEHPANVAQKVERGIDAELPYPVVILGGEVCEMQPYRPVLLDVEDDLPF